MNLQKKEFKDFRTGKTLELVYAPLQQKAIYLERWWTLKELALIRIAPLAPVKKVQEKTSFPLNHATGVHSTDPYVNHTTYNGRRSR